MTSTSDRYRRRWAALAAVAGATALLLPLGAYAANASSAQEPPTACEKSKLPVPDNADMSIVTAGDPSGRYLAGRSYVDGEDRRQVLIWDDGAMREVDVPGLDQSFHDMNSDGHAVGSSYSGDSVETPWLYENGTVRELPGVPNGGAVAINEQGDVAGHRNTEAGNLPVRWMAGSDQVEELSLPEGQIGRTAAIADDGTGIVMVWRDPKGVPDQLLGWRPDGSTFELPLPVGVGWVTGASARGSKVAAAVLTADGKQPRSVLWDLADVQQPKLISREIWMPDAVNERGWIVGYGGSASGLSSVEGGDLLLGGYFASISADGSVLGGYTTEGNGPDDPLWGVQWSCE